MRPKFAGVYLMQTQEGFPVDMSHECLKEKGFDVDWVESFLSAMERSPSEYDTLVKQALSIEANYAKECIDGFIFGMTAFKYDIVSFQAYQEEKRISPISLALETLPKSLSLAP